MQTVQSFVDGLKYNEDGLIPAVVREQDSGQVLMVAYMSRESLLQTLESGRATYFSRSRQKLWVKGETSGHFQYVKDIRLDCDRDTVLITVEQVGPACHEGYRSCFFRQVVVAPDGIEEVLHGDKME